MRDTLPYVAAVIIGEPTEGRVVSAHKGVHAWRTEVTGVPAHSSRPDLAVSRPRLLRRAHHLGAGAHGKRPADQASPANCSSPRTPRCTSAPSRAAMRPTSLPRMLACIGSCATCPAIPLTRYARESMTSPPDWPSRCRSTHRSAPSRHWRTTPRYRRSRRSPTARQRRWPLR